MFCGLLMLNSFGLIGPNNLMKFTNDLREKVPRIFTFEMRQDDPSKCTSAKMRKFGYATPIRKERIARESIVLNPSGMSYVARNDREGAQRHGLVVIDCSWNLASSVFTTNFKGNQRRLPALLAWNPTNYSKLGSLSSIEAVAATLYIMDLKTVSEKILSLYKWGPTFLTLNHDALEDYSGAVTPGQITELEQAYFPRHIAR